MRTMQKGDIVQCDMAFTANLLGEAPDGYIAGTASTAATDSYGHKVLPGAFNKSIKSKGLSGPKGVKLLAGHDWNRPAGVIKRLETVQSDLKIEAQMNLNISYVRDLYEAAKQNEGLSFSVGFRVEEFDYIDEEEALDGEFVQIKSGDLMEVSIVCFPACVDATMSFIKQVEAPSDFEKALMNSELALSRNQAHKLLQLCKTNIHLFQTPMSVVDTTPKHPMLDAPQLKAAIDLAMRAKAVLGSR